MTTQLDMHPTHDLAKGYRLTTEASDGMITVTVTIRPRCGFGDVVAEVVGVKCFAEFKDELESLPSDRGTLVYCKGDVSPSGPGLTPVGLWVW